MACSWTTCANPAPIDGLSRCTNAARVCRIEGGWIFSRCQSSADATREHRSMPRWQYRLKTGRAEALVGHMVSSRERSISSLSSIVPSSCCGSCLATLDGTLGSSPVFIARARSGQESNPTAPGLHLTGGKHPPHSKVRLPLRLSQLSEHHDWQCAVSADAMAMLRALKNLIQTKIPRVVHSFVSFTLTDVGFVQVGVSYTTRVNL